MIPAENSIEFGAAILISDSQTIARATHWRIQWKFGAAISISDSDSDAGCSARSSPIPPRFRFEFAGELRFRFQIIIILNSGAFL